VQPEQLVALAYTGMRFAPLTLITPLFFLTYIPLMIRTFFTLAIVLIVGFSFDKSQISTLGKDIKPLVLASEFIIGIVLALGFHAVSAALHMMAQLIDIQIGISAGATFDPLNYQTNSPTGTLLSLVVVAVFFSTNLHYEFLYALRETFRVLPLGTEITVTNNYFVSISKLFAASFVLAGPVIIVLFLTDITLALISRSMPQAQIYFVALPLKIMIGILMLALTLKLSHQYFYQLLSGALSTWDQVEIK
jgi:flagellar biosynthesis protein FliR